MALSVSTPHRRFWSKTEIAVARALVILHNRDVSNRSGVTKTRRLACSGGSPRRRRRSEIDSLQFDVQSQCTRDPDMQRLLRHAKRDARVFTFSALA